MNIKFNLIIIAVLLSCAMGRAAKINNNIKPYVGTLTPVTLDKSSLGIMGKYATGLYEDEKGDILVKVVVPGSPEKPRLSKNTIRRFNASDVIISDVPAFYWTYGCSATSAGMYCGYFDRNGYSNLYTGSINGGVCPLDNSAWRKTIADGECSFIASHQGIDGRTTRGHVDDYWQAYGSTNDPYYGLWTPHNLLDSGDCLADFMGTSQYYPADILNSDGQTSYFYYLEGDPYSSIDFGDLAYGVQRYIRAKGYSVSSYYNQLIEGYNGNTAGFTFDQYRAEIDSNNPVLMHICGHTILGVGYNTSSNTVYLHDTWDYSQHTMTWGGIYCDFPHVAVTVLHIDPEVPLSAPTYVQASSGTYADKVHVAWDAVPGATHYKVYAGDRNACRTYASSWISSTSYDFTEGSSDLTYLFWVLAASSEEGDRISDYSLSADGYKVTKTSYEDWISATDVSSEEQARNDTPAGDGIENIVKYAMGLDPAAPYNWTNVFTSAKNDYDQEFYVLYTEAKEAEVSVIPEWKNSLSDSSWMSTGGVRRLLNATDASETLKFAIPLHSQGFIRFSVSSEE